MSREVWITGIGLTSSLGEGIDAHWQAMAVAEHPKPVIDTVSCAPYPVHPMVPLNFDLQIPKRGDQRQMENWQRVGTYTAGLALGDAGIAGNMGHSRQHPHRRRGERGRARLRRRRRDPRGHRQGRIAQRIPQRAPLQRPPPDALSCPVAHLLAGNISIVHKVTGSSRTLLGEESAGISAVEVAERRIRAGQGDIFLVGGTVIAERKDSIMILAGGGWGWKGDPISVWARPEKGGGSINGSVSAFLVLEAREHAEARGKTPYAELGPVLSDRSMRRPGEAAAMRAGSSRRSARRRIIIPSQSFPAPAESPGRRARSASSSPS